MKIPRLAAVLLLSAWPLAGQQYEIYRQFVGISPSTFADWIEQLSAEQITGGCGGGNYCPLNANTRGQMAVFLVKTFGLE